MGFLSSLDNGQSESWRIRTGERYGTEGGSDARPHAWPAPCKVGSDPAARRAGGCHGLAAAVAIAVTFWIGLPIASAQPPARPAASTSQAAPSASQPVGAGDVGDSLTVDTMDQRIRQIESTSSLDEATRNKVIDLYRQARSQLELVKAHEAKAAEFEKSVTEAPALLTQYKQRLSEMSAQQTTSAPTSGPASQASQPATQPAADPTGQKLARLESELTTAEASLRAKRQLIQSLSDEAKARSDRLTAIPELTTDLRKQLDKILADLALPTDGSSELVLAQRAHALARKRSIQSEMRLYEIESRSYEQRNDLLTTMRDLARLEARDANQRFKRAQDAVIAQRKADAERQQELAKKEVENAPLAMRQIAEANLTLANDRATVTAASERAALDLSGIL